MLATKRPATIEPEEVLRNDPTHKQGLKFVGDEQYAKTYDGLVDQLLLKISDTFKMRKRYLKEADKKRAELKKYCDEIQDSICGFEVFSDSNQSD